MNKMCIKIMIILALISSSNLLANTKNRRSSNTSNVFIKSQNNNKVGQNTRQNSGAFIGLNLGGSIIHQELKLSKSDATKAEHRGQFYANVRVGWTNYKTPSILFYRVYLDTSISSIKRSNKNMGITTSSIYLINTYALNLDLSLDVFKLDAMRLGIFVGTGFGGIHANEHNNAQKAKEKARISLYYRDIYVPINVGIMYSYASHMIELGSIISILPTTIYKVCLWSKGSKEECVNINDKKYKDIGIKSSMNIYNIYVGYSYLF